MESICLLFCLFIAVFTLAFLFYILFLPDHEGVCLSLFPMPNLLWISCSQETYGVTTSEYTVSDKSSVSCLSIFHFAGPNFLQWQAAANYLFIKLAHYISRKEQLLFFSILPIMFTNVLEDKMVEALGPLSTSVLKGRLHLFNSNQYSLHQAVLIPFSFHSKENTLCVGWVLFNFPYSFEEC